MIQHRLGLLVFLMVGKDSIVDCVASKLIGGSFNVGIILVHWLF